MDTLHLFHELEKILRRDDCYCMDDGTLLKNKIVEDALSVKPRLIKHLLSHDGIKNNFFREVEGVQVFDSVKFQRFVMNKSFLADSYTSFKNKIGLTDEEGHFISESREVVLSWPYKDCMLEGGQTKEDAKRDEVFWNEILAPDEISRLTEPKVFTNFKRYDKDGVHDVDHLSPDDNLIIKGNNQFSLFSLLKKFAHRIKLIYIDPPYNTGNDGFGYNDNFKQSTWLTFMRSRLELAYQLLSIDGTIAISIDNYEIGYLLVLLDSIFGRVNRKNIITVKRASASGAKVINPGVVNVVEYVVLYSRNTEFWKPNRIFQSKSYDERYNNFIINPNDHYSNWQFTTVLEAWANSNNIAKSKLKKKFGSEYENELEHFVINHSTQVIRWAALDDNQIGSEALTIKNKSLESPNTIFYLKRDKAKDYYIKNGQALLFAKDRMINVDGSNTFGQPATDIWDDVLPNDLHNEGGVDFKKGKKPEKLIARIVELCTSVNDVVLDYFVGSGTTAAVSHKMGRQYIVCEQLDYANNDSVNRIRNVINGEQHGISKTYNWHGGGSFVYCELAKANGKFIDEIQSASTTDELKAIWDRMKATDYLNYKVMPSEIDANVTEFEALNLNDQKRFLTECLDKNLLYVPLSDIDSDEYGIGEDDRRLTREFYAE